MRMRTTFKISIHSVLSHAIEKRKKLSSSWNFYVECVRLSAQDV